MVEQLRRLPNVYFLGHKPLPEVPEYVSRFDVCLSLLRAGMEDNDVLSTRIYEYLSTGLPIVSMFGPEQVEEYPDVIYGAHGAAEFTDLCQKALTENNNWLRQRRRDYGAAAAWNGRTEEITRILETNGLL
jgi:glycosyltransferase involved in cell wall biosynthesis